MEGDEDIRLGMESGFDSSPMARLLLEYSGNSDNLEASTLLMEMNINLALDISELPPDMIKDRGPDRDKEVPCYHLNALSLNRITTAVTEQQIFLDCAAGLIMEWSSYLKVNPGDTLLPILKGTSVFRQFSFHRFLNLRNSKKSSKTRKHQNLGTYVPFHGNLVAGSPIIKPS